eukprot:TRINITY_DN9245_c0_g1_i6.p2 TRINITY_DN9245_c0_g1~~TRINITY_DN9245_c0_g1_i6.p2  ORF type:complete len:114 (-),score=0.37 TRINITY_DN9245_c0_g1_i6:691-1032(-)
MNTFECEIVLQTMQATISQYDIGNMSHHQVYYSLQQQQTYRCQIICQGLLSFNVIVNMLNISRGVVRCQCQTQKEKFCGSSKYEIVQLQTLTEWFIFMVHIFTFWFDSVYLAI